MPGRAQHLAGELVPAHGALVGDVERARDAGRPPGVGSSPARSSAKVGWPRWSSTKRSVSCSPGQAQDRLDHVGAVVAAHPRGAHDRVVGVELELAGQLRRPYTDWGWACPTRRRGRPWCRRTRSRSRTWQIRAPTRRAASATWRTAEGVDGEGPVGSPSQASTAVHAAALNDGVGLERGDGAEHVRRGRRRRGRRGRRRPRRDRRTPSTSSRPTCPPAPVMRMRTAASGLSGPLEWFPPPAVVAVPRRRWLASASSSVRSGASPAR